VTRRLRGEAAGAGIKLPSAVPSGAAGGALCFFIECLLRALSCRSFSIGLSNNCEASGHLLFKADDIGYEQAAQRHFAFVARSLAQKWFEA
jgi:hypothetical protein